MHKAEARQEFRKFWREEKHTARNWSRWVIQVNEELKKLLLQKRGIWGGYQARPDEIEISLSSPAHHEVNWVFPRIEGSTLQYYTMKSEKTNLHTWGVREPDPSLEDKISVTQMTGVVVPGLAFDSRGFRLGRGPGYFDRFLANQKLIKVGVTLSCCLVTELETEAHDIPMDYIVTECGVHDFSSSVR